MEIVGDMAPLNAGELVLRSRYAIWFPELRWLVKNVTIPDNVPINSPWSVLVMAKDFANDLPMDEHIRTFTEFVAHGRRSTRFDTVVRQMLAELLSHLGHVDAALHQIDGAVGSGLFDATWAERCPALTAVRADPRFAPFQRVIADRALAVRNALGV
jgi:hypothetical protein